MNQQLLIGLVLGLVFGVAITILAVKDSTSFLSGARSSTTNASCADTDIHCASWRECLNVYRATGDWEGFRQCTKAVGYDTAD